MRLCLIDVNVSVFVVHKRTFTVYSNRSKWWYLEYIFIKIELDVFTFFMVRRILYDFRVVKLLIKIIILCIHEIK